MANPEGAARTNYFFVKDMDAFLDWADLLLDIELAKKEMPQPENPRAEAVALLSTDECGFFPNQRYASAKDRDEGNDTIDIDIAQELSQHLRDGQVAILMHSGHEKLRSVWGYAIAIYSDGSRLQISLDDIYDKVKREWGITPTQASY